MIEGKGEVAWGLLTLRLREIPTGYSGLGERPLLWRVEAKNMKRSLIALAAILVLCSTASAQLFGKKRPKQQAAPCSTPVQPIRYHALTMLYRINFTYTPKDPTGAHELTPTLLNARFNSAGQGDGNTFSEANGVEPNFYFTVTLSDTDGNNHFTAYAEFSGWGQGHITNLSSGQYPFTNPIDAINAVVDQAYSYIHGGWHDSRPSCPQS